VTARHQFTVPDHGYGASVSHAAPVHINPNFATFASTHYAYPQRDGQAELTWACDTVQIKRLQGHTAIIT